MHPVSRTTSFNRRALSLGSPRASRPAAHQVWRDFKVVVAVGFSLTFLLVVSGSYFVVIPSLKSTFYGDNASNVSESTGPCDVFSGSWVRVLDGSVPQYNASECPFAERGFNCLGNGRTDQDYLTWRWKPWNCDIMRFDVRLVLEWLRNKRVVFVGDSMSRTQWESLICLLMTGVEDKKSVYEVNGSIITKRIRFLGVRFSTFNFTIEFFRSVFLVEHGWTPRNVPKRVRSTVKLDKLDEISHRWIGSDVLVFNTGHWWVPGKLFETGCYFQVGSSVKLGMSIPAAYRRALETWASWVNSAVDGTRTRVFFRTFEPSHWGDDNRTGRGCNLTRNPSQDPGGRDRHEFSVIATEVAKTMTVPVTILGITPLSAYRNDAHVGTWTENPSIPDCSHWCLPGVPDMWNEILLSLLIRDGFPT
ncbi:hypothetical protein MLD38_028431 [Melastoma candidum]|uniref:Uncharacterized protein n=1 Tax=Melastoma candidum TaxID=119954 RepID=A0ACB9N1J9_9MYRT|nr:hypothetical protein MLD38_028431 [Melastoma candidum]